MTPKNGFWSMLPLLIALLSTAVGITLWAESRYADVGEKCEERIDAHAVESLGVFAGKSDVAAACAKIDMLIISVDKLSTKVDALQSRKSD